MSASTVRDNAVALARHDPKAALARARSIGDPWCRAQALAWVAWLTPDEDAFRQIVAESLKSAQGAADPYQRVGASAWAVRALVERRHGAQAATVIRQVSTSAPQIENPVSRADAVFLLFQAALPLGPQAVQGLVSALVAACSATSGWKGQHILRDTALMLAAVDGAAARQVISAMREGRERRQAERRITDGQFMPPCAFFWRDPKGPVEP